MLVLALVLLWALCALPLKESVRLIVVVLAALVIILFALDVPIGFSIHR